MFVTPALAETHGTDGAQGESAHGAVQTGEMHTTTQVAEHGEVFPPFDSAGFASQLLWLAITFGLFYVFMDKVIVPRIGSILEHRRDRIAQDLDEAARLKEEADNAIAAYEQDLATARKQASEIAQTERDKAKQAADLERTRVDTELSSRMADAEKSIAIIKAKALGEVDAIATDAASDLVEHLLGGKVTKAQASAAVRGLTGK